MTTENEIAVAVLHLKDAVLHLYLGFDGAQYWIAAPPGARGAGVGAVPRHLTVRG